MMKSDLSPSFEIHRDWLEKLVTDTPSKSKTSSKPSLLTTHDPSTEHVLRGSKSFAARSFKSRTSGNSLRVPSSNKENRSTSDGEIRETSRESSGQRAHIAGPVLGEIAPNGQILRPGAFKLRPSPTPSLKKKRAEAIVRAHGSPQHVRVTAGGRIVPSEQSPLCHPRYGYSAIKTNGGLIKFAPNHPMGKTQQWTQATQNGFIAQDVNGRLCQIVNGTILPLNEVDGALRLYIPAPNLDITSRGSSLGPLGQGPVGMNGNQQHAMPQNASISPPDPPVAAQTNALELEYSKLEQELKELDKTEVLHGRTMGKAAKDALIGKRRELIVTLDNIRKAIKSIKSMPPPEAPVSPRAMRGQQSMSPPRSRLPAFLKHRMQNSMALPPMQPPYKHFFGEPQGQAFSAPYGFQQTPSSDVPYNAQPFGMVPPAMFVPPPPFDGSMAPFAPYQVPIGSGVPGTQPTKSAAASQSEAPGFDVHLPQTDGARSFADLQRVGSPRHSRALDIKAPEPKSAAALKSTLNPESPAYKPGTGVLSKAENIDRPFARSVKDRAPTPLSPLHQLRPSAAVTRTANNTNDTISPTKKSPHLHSSSISSFETADFFPRNTREYSTRKYAYPEPTEQSEDKENTSPPQPGREGEGSSATTGQGSFVAKDGSADKLKVPAAPPGTPVGLSAATTCADLPIIVNGTSVKQRNNVSEAGSLPDRQVHNLSPKGRRTEYLFVQEHPSQYPTQPSSSPEKFKSAFEELCVTASPHHNIDFTEASTEWIEGYRAGLARRPVEADRQGDFLDGYCAGLLKSKPANIGASTGSPTKSTSRRPSPVVVQSRTSSRMQQDRREGEVVRAPFENQVKSMDTLKQAVFAPQNEDALLSPSLDEPCASEPPFNLGVWSKNHDVATSIDRMTSSGGDDLAGFPFPHRTSSMLKRQGIMSESGVDAQQHAPQLSVGTDTSMLPSAVVSELFGSQAPPSLASSATSLKSFNPGSSDATSNRVTSVTSIDSHLYRQWPGHRVFSPHLEWKSATSVAQAAGLAAGHFANAQFDGASQVLLGQSSAVTDINPTTGASQPQRAVLATSNPVMGTHSRFREGSIDGITNPPNSPQPFSPPMSPSLPPKDSSARASKKDSPSKSSSPAKVKFQDIAEKVGIKVSGKKKDDSGSPSSPPNKRGWRDVWRGARKEPSQDESAPILGA